MTTTHDAGAEPGKDAAKMATSATNVDRKSTQRERILNSMTRVVAREGYAPSSIAQVIAEAGVSRPTFYEYFDDKDDCFLTALRANAEHMLEQVERAVAEQPPERALESAVTAILDFADAEPTRARALMLMAQALAGGPRALDERDRTIDRIETILERANAELSPLSVCPDVPAGAVIGAVHWLLSVRIRRGLRSHEGFKKELVSWLERYEQPRGEHRWGTLAPSSPPPPPPAYTSELSPTAPSPLPQKRAARSLEEVARNQRERIIYATAEAAAEKGLHAITIADITDGAGLDTRAFYAHFRDKQDAFLAAIEHSYQHTMAVSAGAYFSGADWPERVWLGILAGGHFLAAHPALTHILYAQSFAVDSPAIERVEDVGAAFTIFLQEGNRHTAVVQPQTTMDAIFATSFEIAYRLSRRGRGDQMGLMACHVVYLSLAAFLGPRATNEFIDGRVGGDAGPHET